MKLRKKLLVGFGTALILLTILFINFFIWPFTTSHPNYSDVENAYAAIKIPSGWTVENVTINKGIAGRACPIEGSGCFSKRAVLKLPNGVDSTVYTRFLADNNCVGISVSDSSNKTTKTQTYYCALAGGLKLGSDFRVDAREATLRIFTN